MTLLSQPLISALEIIFIYALFLDGMILARVRRHFDKHSFHFVRKPIYACPVCMTSFWGTLFYLFQWQGIIDFHLNQYVTFIFTTGGILVLLAGIVGKFEDDNGEDFVNYKQQMFDGWDKYKEANQKPNFSNSLWNKVQEMKIRKNKKPE